MEIDISVFQFAQSMIVSVEPHSLPLLAWKPMAQLHQPHTFDVHFLICPVICNMVSVVISQTFLHTCFLVGGGQQAACKRPGSESVQVHRLCGLCAQFCLTG